MNGTASAKARNDVDGKPGSSVDACRPPELTARSASGKTSGGIALAGCLAVRVTDRLASAPTCVARTLTRGPRRAPMRGWTRLASRFGGLRLRCALERATGLGEE